MRGAEAGTGQSPELAGEPGGVSPRGAQGGVGHSRGAQSPGPSPHSRGLQSTHDCKQLVLGGPPAAVRAFLHLLIPAQLRGAGQRTGGFSSLVLLHPADARHPSPTCPSPGCPSGPHHSSSLAPWACLSDPAPPALGP